MKKFQNMYYHLIGKVSNLQEFVEAIDNKDNLTSDINQLLINIIEESEEECMKDDKSLCIVH